MTAKAASGSVGKAEEHILDAVAKEFDSTQLGGILDAANDVLAASQEDAEATDCLARAKVIRAMDRIAFNVRTPEVTKIESESADFVTATLYLATWSKKKEQEFLEKGYLPSHGETPTTADSKTERDLVLRMGGSRLLEWEHWLGPLPWLQEGRNRIATLKGQRFQLFIREAERQSESTLADLMAYYKNRKNFEALSIDFVVRKPSFTLPNPALNTFFRDLIHGANVLLKIRIPRAGVNDRLGRCISKVLGKESLAARATNGGLRSSVMLAFGSRFREIAQQIASFLPAPKEVKAALTGLASRHRSRAEANRAAARELLNPDSNLLK